MAEELQITRRRILKGLSTTALAPLLGANLIGCSDSSDRAPINSVPADFRHGVASGDPLSDRVILWTRLTPELEGTVSVDWEIATDPDFSTIVASGGGTTTATVDYTVKVDAEGLAPATRYYYRFLSGDKVSAVGQTLTAPASGAPAVSFAVVSCANYPAGYFHGYREIAKREIDAVLHLGDYIYEYAADGYGSDIAEQLGRVSQPETELFSLGDYRARYAQYRSDEDLQACHMSHPFIVVWDDHEVANNTWKEGAENHDPGTEGDFFARRSNAIQAWYEWLPVRPPASAKEIIYRRFQYGEQLDLLMLDTRIIGRDQQLDYEDFTNGELIDVDTARAAIGDPGRSILGEEQRDWLKAALTDSTANWQVLGQQVVMGRLVLPEPVVRPLYSIGDGGLGSLTAAMLASLAAKRKPVEERTPEEQALLDSAIPYNLDLWDGYAYEREDILEHARQMQSRLVVLSGDLHNSWGLQLTTEDGSVAGVEFAGTSVTSPGIEAVLGADNATLFAPLAVNLVDDLKYANLVERGFLEVSFTSDEVTAGWHYVSDITQREYRPLDDVARFMTVDRADLRLA